MRGSRLSAEQERALVVAAEGGDAAACRQLVDSFLPAIGAVARRINTGGRVQRSELMQEGVAGLLFAARRYDPRMETPFWGYASFWVRKAMQELVAELTRPAALSDHAVRGLAQLKAVRRDHVQASGAEPTRAELAAATGFTHAQLESLLSGLPWRRITRCRSSPPSTSSRWSRNGPARRRPSTTRTRARCSA